MPVVATKGLITPADDFRHCADQVMRRRAGFIDALERANTPFDQTTTTTAVEEEELEVVVENGQDDDLGGEGYYQDRRSTEAVEDGMPCCLIGEMPSCLIDIYSGKIHYFE